MKTSRGIRSSLMRECCLRCSARRVLLIIVLLVIVRFSWLSLFSTSSRSGRARVSNSSENNYLLPWLHGRKSGLHMTQSVPAAGLEARNGSFYLRGKPFRIISGSFHYFRTHPEQWKDRLERMKAAYVNTVTTYIPWNLYERQRGVFNFTVDGWDIVRFIKLVQEMQLHLIIRPGPYICAEWEFGGFPSWLLHDPNMVIRTSTYLPYLGYVEQYFNKLLPLLASFTHQRGGPIIAFQVENEFGSSRASPDKAYLRFLVNLFRSNNIHELLFTSDGATQLSLGTIPEALATVNCAAASRLKTLRHFQPGKPMMVTEFWPGWFDHWGEEHHTMAVDKFNAAVDGILEYGASVNLYMFVGGTNFWFWNGANYEKQMTRPTITSYDYDALISECGDVHPQKYKAFRSLLKKHGLLTASQLQPVPLDHPKEAYGFVKIEQVMTMDSICKHVGETLTLQDPVFMELLPLNGYSGQGYGYIVYRAFFRGSSLTLKGSLHDWAQVFVNGQLVKTIDARTDIKINKRVDFNVHKSEQNCLEILVENMGHINYINRAMRHVSSLRKGFEGEVLSSAEKIKNWEHIPLEFDSHLLDAIQSSKDWKPFANDSTTTRLYQGSFTILQDPLDTFLDMSGWGKGVAVVNGFVLGRYWNIGPQKTLYVPWPLLKKGKNEVMVFELQKVGSAFKFIDKPVLRGRL